MDGKALIGVFVAAAGLSLLLAAAPATRTAIDYSQSNWYGGPVYTGKPALAVTAANEFRRQRDAVVQREAG